MVHLLCPGVTKRRRQNVCQPDEPMGSGADATEDGRGGGSESQIPAEKEKQERSQQKREGTTILTCLKTEVLGEFHEPDQPGHVQDWVQNENVGLLVSRQNVSKWHWQSFKLNRGPSPVDPVCGPNWKGLILFPRGLKSQEPPLPGRPESAGLTSSLLLIQHCFFLACFFFFFNSAASCINILQFPYEKFPRGPS